MPELPEVETICHQLNKSVAQKTVIDIVVGYPNRLSPDNFIELLKGRTIKSVNRRAKLLMFNLDNDYCLIAHLKMTGRFTVSKEKPVLTKHDHVLFVLNDGYMTWSDIRKFGYLRVVDTKTREAIDKSYGPEPLEHSAQFLAEHLAKIAAKRSLKAALLDQTVIAGVGNIYTDEACFQAKLLPSRIVQTIPSLLPLISQLQSILRQSIAKQGTSAHNYKDIYGNRGEFAKSLHVYGRANKPCTVCQTPLTRITFAGRGTHICTTCQK